MENARIGQRMAGPVTDPADLACVFQRAVAEVERGGVALVDVQTALK